MSKTTTHREGTRHFWHVRLTALALIPLTVWFLASLVHHAGADFETARGFFAQPLAAGLTLLLLIAGFYHLALGMQVIIGDYIHGTGLRVTLHVLNIFFCACIGFVSVVAVLRLSFVG